MIEKVEQQICIKFCIKLEHYFTKTIQMIQKAKDTGNWWSAASSQQFTSCPVQFFDKTSNHAGDSASLPHTQNPDLASCDFWLFPKLKSLLKGKRFQTVNEIQDNTTGQPMVIGRTVWGPKVPTLKGTEASLSCVQCFLYLVSSINVSIFHIIWPDTFWTNLIHAMEYYSVPCFWTLFSLLSVYLHPESHSIKLLDKETTSKNKHLG